MENTATVPVAEKTSAMRPASTEISREASAKVDALAIKDDRSRAYVLREIIHEWANRQPTPKTQKSR